MSSKATSTPGPAAGLNLIQKLAKIRAIADVVQKKKRGYNYNYSDVTDILAKVTAGMEKYHVSLLPQIVPGTTSVRQLVSTNTKVDKAGNPYDQTTTEMLVSADMVFCWMDEDSGESIDIPWTLVGAQADPSQAFGSGLSYCTRYFLTSYFQIGQTDTDVDAYRRKQREASDQESLVVAASIIEEFDARLKAFLADHSNMSDEIMNFVSQYAKKADYRVIKNPELAAKLLNDFKAKYLKGVTE